MRSVASQVIAVVPPDLDEIPDDIAAEVDLIVPGGASRAASVAAGLAHVNDPSAWVLVHDAARPCCSASLGQRVVDALGAGARGVVPVVPLTDTPKRLNDRGTLETLDRASLRAAQTPQGFVVGDLVNALRAAAAEGIEPTDDGAALELLGVEVVAVDGDLANLKVTRPDDIESVRRWLAEQEVTRER